VIYTYIKYVANFMHILCWSKKIIDIFLKKRNQQVTGGPRLKTENILRVIRGVVEIETD
jgi:hypothetical protein